MRRGTTCLSAPPFELLREPEPPPSGGPGQAPASRWAKRITSAFRQGNSPSGDSQPRERDRDLTPSPREDSLQEPPERRAWTAAARVGMPAVVHARCGARAGAGYGSWEVADMPRGSSPKRERQYEHI